MSKLVVHLNDPPLSQLDLTNLLINRGKAAKGGNIKFVTDQPNNKKAIQFTLPSKPENHNIELSHFQLWGKEVESLYQFGVKIIRVPRRTVFFRITENHPESPQPAVALSVNRHKEIYLTINHAGQNKTISEQVARLGCDRDWYDFKVKVEWKCENPSVQLEINERAAFSLFGPFGYEGGRHVARFGIFVPGQTGYDVCESPVIMFDRYSEIHKNSTTLSNLSRKNNMASHRKPSGLDLRAECRKPPVGCQKPPVDCHKPSANRHKPSANRHKP